MWLRDTSPSAIKSEPEEDNGFYPSPQHNKTSKREYDDEEWVSYKLNQIFTLCFVKKGHAPDASWSVTVCSVIWDNIINTFVYRFVYKPKKVKTEHDKKAKKRKHEYEDDEEDEVHYVFI